MLILRRKEGQWVELTHRSGETVRIRVYNIRSRFPGQLDLAFDDPEHNFSIQRPERGTRRAPDGEVTPPAAAPSPVPMPITVDTDPFTTAGVPVV